MKNVLYLHNSSEISGGERSLLQLWNNLDRQEVRPFLAIPSDGPFVDEARHLEIEVAFWKAPSLRVATGFELISFYKSLSAIVKKWKIDLIHSYGPRNNLIGALVAKRYGIPIIWHERNLIYGPELDVTRLFLALPDAVICNSKAVAERFVRRDKSTPKKVRVILNGVDLKYFVPPADKAEAKREFDWEGKKVIGLVSNLEVRKGVEMFLEIAALIGKRRDDIVFVVVGGPYGGGEERLRALSAEAGRLGLSGKVIWTGFQADIRPYVQAFDVACNVTVKEACSRAILEAMAAGVPVMAYRDGGNSELVVNDQTGILVRPGEKEAFAANLFKIIEDRDVLRRLGERGRVRAEQLFDVKNNALTTFNLYDDLLRRKT